MVECRNCPAAFTVGLTNTVANDDVAVSQNFFSMADSGVFVWGLGSKNCVNWFNWRHRGLSEKQNCLAYEGFLYAHVFLGLRP